MLDVCIDNETIAASGTFTSDGISLGGVHNGFSLYVEVTGDGSADFFHYISLDGKNFVRQTRAIKRGFTKTSGPGGDGKDVFSIPVMPCDAIKIEAVNTDGSNGIVVTAKVLMRPGSFGDYPVYDGSTSAISVIDYAHHEVHGGSSYWAAVNATLGNAEVATIGFTTPNTTKWAHLLLQVDVNASCAFDVLESVTSFSGGAAYTIRNFDRNSTNSSGMTVITGYTGSDLITPTGGTTIWAENLGTKGVSTSRENSSELIMKQNTKYLFRVTNGATSNAMTILLTWYEHTNR